MQCTECDKFNLYKSNQKPIVFPIKLVHILLSISGITWSHTTFKSNLNLCNYDCQNCAHCSIALLGGNRDTVVDPETLFVWRDCFKNIDKERESATEKDTKEKVKILCISQ